MVLREISKLKKAIAEPEQSRFALSTLVQSVQQRVERQMKGLAQKLQEDFGQRLSGLSLELRVIERRLISQNPTVQEAVPAFQNIF